MAGVVEGVKQLQAYARAWAMNWLVDRTQEILMEAQIKLLDGPFAGETVLADGPAEVRLVFLYDKKEVLVYAREWNDPKAYRFRPNASLLLSRDFDRVVAEYPGTPLEFANAQLPQGCTAA